MYDLGGGTPLGLGCDSSGLGLHEGGIGCKCKGVTPISIDTCGQTNASRGSKSDGRGRTDDGVCVYTFHAGGRVAHVVVVVTAAVADLAADADDDDDDDDAVQRARLPLEIKRARDPAPLIGARESREQEADWCARKERGEGEEEAEAEVEHGSPEAFAG